MITNSILKTNVQKIEQMIKSSEIKWENVFLELLLEDKINFANLLNLYIQSLKEKEKEQRMNINGLALMLSKFIPYNKKYKPDKFVIAKSAYHLIKSKVFHTAPIEKKLFKIIKENKYSEDENGISQIKS